MNEGNKNIISALLKVQSELKNPQNTATNPFFRSKYAPLPDILKITRPLLTKHELLLMQNTGSFEDGTIYVQTELMHSSGEVIKSDKLGLKPDKNTPQGIGSAITYGRRYQLSAILGISSEDDDDGNSAEKSKKSQEKPTKKPKPTNKPKPITSAHSTKPKNKPDPLKNGQLLSDSELTKLSKKNGHLGESISTLSAVDEPITRTKILKELVKMRDANELSDDSKENEDLFNQAKGDLGFKS